MITITYHIPTYTPNTSVIMLADATHPSDYARLPDCQTARGQHLLFALLWLDHFHLLPLGLGLE